MYRRTFLFAWVEKLAVKVEVELREEEAEGERQKQSGKIGGIGSDRLASLEIQLLQQGPRDNAQRTTRAMPPRESWLGERDENNSGRRILRHFAMRRDQ